MENKSSTCHMTNEKRLIDANALQIEPDPWGGMNGVLMLGRSGGKTMATVQAALKRMIDNAPTVDAVEVVRCKDCKFGNCMTVLRPDEVCCELHDFTLWKADGFCSYGERREGE